MLESDVHPRHADKLSALLKMNLPNKLTVSRFVLTALFLWALFSPLRFNDTLALVFFSVAGFTDFLDGSISRRRGLVTNFGILMDPLADKVLVCSAFIAFVESTHLNPGRAGQGRGVDGHHHRRARTGHHRHAVAGGVKKNRSRGGQLWQTQDHLPDRRHQSRCWSLDACDEWAGVAAKIFQPWVPRFAEITLWVTVALTAVSGVIYLWRNRAIYLSDT